MAPSIAPALAALRMPVRREAVDRRVVFIALLAVLVAIASALIAQGLAALIDLATNVAFFGRWSFAHASPADHTRGAWVIAVPVLGAIVVGVMARYGSKAIRGHGIPEAMQTILENESRIPARLTFLKPLSSAICIGTGGPFGAEGPIIATGGALGSLVGQVVRVTSDERKVLLAAGAAAGMSATFGTPVAAVLLAIELLLFEYRARSVVPVALAAATADVVRIAFVGTDPVFAMTTIAAPGWAGLASYTAIGVLVGIASVGVTRLVYRVEDAFERLPIHWMWWPAIGAVAVGVIGYVEPRTLGVGYSNIEGTLTGELAMQTIAVLCILKLVSWAIALGSGTSGGTLAPLLTFGGGLGALLGVVATSIVPGAGVEPTVGALVGMAAMFTGASRAMLASVVFAFETTRQAIGLLPLLAGCSGAYLVSCLLMRESIMTEKIARRGVRVIGDYVADWLEQVPVGRCCTRDVVTLDAKQPIADATRWLVSGEDGSQHQGYPVLDGGELTGVVTRRMLLAATPDARRTVGDLIERPPAVVRESDSARAAADHMIAEKVGRLPVLAADDRLVGILTRSDLLHAHARRLDRAHRAHIVRKVPMPELLAKLGKRAGASDTSNA